MKADEINVQETKAEEVTAYLRPNPQFTLSTDGTQIAPHEGVWQPLRFDGLLGTDVLRPFIVTLDLANARMYLMSDPNSHADRYLFSTIGIQFAQDAEGRFTIMAVWNPSPAARAGLKIGDKIWVSFPPEKIHIYDAKTEQILF